MKTSLLVLGAVLLAGFGVSHARQNTQENPDKSKAAAADSKIPAEAAARVNPVKPTPEGLAEARKVYVYDCDMCHGAKADGKGDVVESMQLTMHAWRDPTTPAGNTDAKLFYTITNAKAHIL